MRTIRNCSVAVVGGAGFLGSHMVDHCIQDRNCKVLVIDNLIAGRREFIHPDATFEHADITGSETHLRKLFQAHKVRFVWNFAAWPYVPTSFERPLHVFNVNAFGALQVINAAQEAGCEGILQWSSAELYGSEMRVMGDFGEDVTPGLNPDERPQTNYPAGSGAISEEYAVEPHSSYGASKAAIDAMVQVRWREAKTPCIALRQFNCIGERDCLHPYVVPAIIEQFLTHQEIDTKYCVGGIQLPKTIRLGNNSTRDFLYAGDAVRMATELLEKGQFGEVYNSGSGESIRIYDLAKLIGKLMGFDDVRVEQDPARVRPWEIWSLKADCRKLYSVISYRPQVDLEEALRRTVRWFQTKESQR